MLKKNFIALSVATILATSSFGADNIDTKTLAAQLDALKAQIAELESRLKESEAKATTSEETTKRIDKLEGDIMNISALQTELSENYLVNETSHKSFENNTGKVVATIIKITAIKITLDVLLTDDLYILL